MNNNQKAISPLIATILLVVVAVALISIVLTWGKGFTNDSLSETTDITKFKPSDVTSFLDIKKGLNGRFFVKYRPPNSFTQSITITHYSLLGLNRIPLEPNVTIAANTTQALDLGIVDETFDLVLYLDDNTIISRIGVKTENRAPSTVDCPTGYVSVPGNFLYDTTNGNNMGFCVAKYEMKVDVNSDGIGDIALDGNTTYCKSRWSSGPTYYNGWCHDEYYNGTAYVSCPTDCNVALYDVVSTAEGYPITHIRQNYASSYDAKNACASLGSNYHLITNEERMTILRNLERVTTNWSGGAIGSGKLKSGNTSTVESGVSYNGSDPDYGTSRNGLAALLLTNDQNIWDFSGNVYEWADKNIQRKNEPEGVYDSNDETYIGWNWFEYADGATYDRYFSDRNGLYYKDLFLINNTYNSDQGTGRIYMYSDPDDTSTIIYGFLFGGNWNYGTYAGPLALSLSYSPSYRTTASAFVV